MLLFGGMKVVRKRADLEATGMLWVEDYADSTLKLIGAAEVLGAIGVILPAATNFLPILSPIAASCLGVLMIGAFGVHVRRKDPAPSLIITGLLVACAAYVAWYGFTG